MLKGEFTQVNIEIYIMDIDYGIAMKLTVIFMLLQCILCKP